MALLSAVAEAKQSNLKRKLPQNPGFSGAHFSKSPITVLSYFGNLLYSIGQCTNNQVFRYERDAKH